MIHADESHTDEIEELLRSGGVMFNPPVGGRSEREPGLTSRFTPVLILSIAAAAGITAYKLLNRAYGPRREERQRERRSADQG